MAPHVVLVGVRGSGFSEGLILRVNIETGETTRLEFADEYNAPSIAVGPDNFFLGDVTSSIITAIDRQRLQSSVEEGKLTRRSYNSASSFLDRGTTQGFSVGPSKRFLFATHFGQNRATAFDIRFSERIDDFRVHEGSSETPVILAKQALSAGLEDISLPFLTVHEIGLLQIRIRKGVRAFAKSQFHRLDQNIGIGKIYDDYLLETSGEGSMLVAASAQSAELVLYRVDTENDVAP